LLCAGVETGERKEGLRRLASNEREKARGRSKRGKGSAFVLSREEFWKFIEPVVHAEGLEIYDIELPSASTKLLRIFLIRPDSPEQFMEEDAQESQVKNSGVGIGDCAKISREIGRLEGFDDLLSAQTTLEVSSPGINRRLRMPKHFAQAQGEHIYLKVYDVARQANRSLRGTLVQFQDNQIFVQEDGTDEVQTFALEDVVNARIDFLFQ
jgi:ribosome maturation factor RimP